MKMEREKRRSQRIKADHVFLILNLNLNLNLNTPMTTIQSRLSGLGLVTDWEV